MLTPDVIRVLLPALLALPVAFAIALRFVDGSRARMTALVAAAVHLLVPIAIVFSGMFDIQDDENLGRSIDRTKKQSERVFAPQFVPGDPMPNGKPSYSTTWDVIPFHGTGAEGERVRLGAVQ